MYCTVHCIEVLLLPYITPLVKTIVNRVYLCKGIAKTLNTHTRPWKFKNRYIEVILTDTICTSYYFLFIMKLWIKVYFICPGAAGKECKAHSTRLLSRFSEKRNIWTSTISQYNSMQNSPVKNLNAYLLHQKLIVWV